MSQRTDRIAGEIQAALGDILSRQGIKDPRVRDAGLLTVTRIDVSGDLRHAKVLFTIFGASDEVMQNAEAGLEHAAAFLQREVARRLRLRLMPLLHFAIDRGYEGAARVDALFRQMQDERRQETQPGGVAPGAAAEEGQEADGDRQPAEEGALVGKPRSSGPPHP